MRRAVAKVRVYELAKELGIESKVVMTKLTELGEFVRSASSTVEPPVVRRLREIFPAPAAAPAPPTPKAPAKKSAPAADAADAPAVVVAEPVAPVPAAVAPSAPAVAAAPSPFAPLRRER